jgi:hypothetical protein
LLELVSNLLMEQAGASLLGHSLAPRDFQPLSTFSKTFVGVGADIQLPILVRHMFQTCETGSPEEYGRIEETFSPKALHLMGDWILSRVAKPR